MKNDEGHQEARGKGSYELKGMAEVECLKPKDCMQRLAWFFLIAMIRHPEGNVSHPSHEGKEDTKHLKMECKRRKKEEKRGLLLDLLSSQNLEKS